MFPFLCKTERFMKLKWTSWRKEVMGFERKTDAVN